MKAWIDITNWKVKPGHGVIPWVAFSIEKKLIFVLSLGCAFDSTCRHLFLLKWFCLCSSMKKLESISIPQGSLVWWHYIYSVYIIKFRLFVNVRNRKDVVLKTSRAVVIRWFSLNEAPLGLFKFIFDYLPYFEKINIFFNIITKLEAQWAEPVSLTFHFALRKLNTEPPIGAYHQVLVIWLSSYREEDI